MRPAIIATALAGLLTASFTLPSTPVAASDPSVFTGPAYPSDECTAVVNTGTTAAPNWQPFGLVPQQWNSSVGLPLSITGTPSRQRIVIPEFDQIPSMPAVNALLRQCGLLADSEPDVTVTYQTLPTDVWGTAAETLGGEATLDASVVFGALPPNTDVYIANASGVGTWYGFFVNAAQACGVEFATTPTPTDTPAQVPNISKGPDFPLGGCIITGSWGSAELVVFPSQTSEAASVLLDQLAALGVMVFMSAGDEGAGGCLSATQQTSITNFALSSSAGTTPINGTNFFTGTMTVTTSAPHGYVVGNIVFLSGLSGFTDAADLNGNYLVSAVTSNTFEVKIPLGISLTIAPSAATGNAFKVGINFGATFDEAFLAHGFLIQVGALTPQFPATHPDVVAVGGTQWLPQLNTVSPVGLQIIYEPGRPYQNFVWKDSNANPNCFNAPNPQSLGQEGTGGGISRVFPMPSYQQTQAQANYGSSATNRMIPDVAALAGWPMYGIPNPTPAGNIYCAGNNFPCAADTFPWTPVVGTSAATPLTAIGFANVNAALTSRGFTSITKGGPNDVHSLIYSAANAAAFNDVPEFRGAVRSGNNNLLGELGNVTMGYAALDGYDMTTGMGVPNFTALANLLIARNTPAPPGPGPGPAPVPTPAPLPTPDTKPNGPAPQPAPDPVASVIANPSAVTSGTMTSLTPAQVAAIPPATFAELPPRAFIGMTPDQVRALSRAQVSTIRPARARAIRPAVLRSFSPTQIRVLRPKSVQALRPEQVRLLRPLQLRAMTPKQVGQFRPKQKAVMTAAQLRALKRHSR
jgi:hypothetical protein